MDRDAARNAGRLLFLLHQRASTTAFRLSGVAALALTVANCAQQPPQVAGGGRQIDPKYGVAPSPRVVADGESVPKGGGRALVGRPYVIAGRTYVPSENARYSREGLASWYGAEFHGRMTANGEVFDKDSIAAAHPTMPLPSYARITNLYNQRSIIVRVNDRGPYHANRLIDVSQQAAEALEFKRAGTARVRVDYVGKAGLAGSDDRILMASLRTDGMPAALQMSTPIMVAQATPRSTPSRETFTSRTEVERIAEPSVRPTVVAQAAPSPGRLVHNVMLPPERPFDLGRPAAAPVRTAAMPARTAHAALPPPRRQLAGLYYVSPEASDAAAWTDTPFRPLRTEKVIALRPAP